MNQKIELLERDLKKKDEKSKENSKWVTHLEIENEKLENENRIN